MEQKVVKGTLPQGRIAETKGLVSAAEKTVKNWPQWKRETYNVSFAIATGSKKY